MASGVEVAQAYITIIPSMQGIQGQIAKELGAEKVGQKAGKDLGKGIKQGTAKSSDALMKSFGSVGDRIAFKTKTGLNTAFSSVAQNAKSKMGAAAESITGKFKAVGDKIGSTGIGKAFGTVATTAKGAFDKVTGTIRGVASFAGDAFRDVAGKIGEKLSPITQKARAVFDKVGSAASSGFSAAVKAATIGAAGVAAALGTITTAAIGSYADYEQLAGGVDKLFGSASDKLKQYAQEAYKTAGMSANDYMEQATSFSASLIKSVGGDTAEAARLADVAMRAMSDNVNTFGSNAQDVQNAVMGLSRENYTMLDNLKLGYAGTKEGMMQLINDSGVLGETLTDTSQLGEVGFGRMIEAIQAVQEQQGIAGTTAREAAGTISGSIEMTKASWQNLMTELGKDDGNVSARVGEVVDSALAVLANVAPRIPVIVGALMSEVPQALAENGPKVTKALTSVLDGATNGAFSKAVGIIKPYADRIGAAMSGLWNRLKPLSPIVQEIGSKLGGVLVKALGVATSAFEKVAPIIATIAEHGLPILSSAIGATSSAFDAIMTVMGPVASFLTDTLGTAIDWVGTKLEEFAAWIEEKFGVVADVVSGFSDALSDPFGAIGDMAKKAGKALTGTADDASKSAEKAAKATKKGYGEVSKSVTTGTANAATNASKNMSSAASSVSKQSGSAASSAEKNGQRIEKAWNKTYTTKMNATANTSSAESTMRGFKNKWTSFGVTGKAYMDTSPASRALSDFKYRNNNFVVTGSVQIRNAAGKVTVGYQAAGGVIVQKHAEGYIANRPGRGVNLTQHIVGEAGAEAVIPLTNRRYVAPFAQTVADYINADRGVTITGCTFIVRKESDIDAIGRAINRDAQRQQRARLRHG